MRLPTEVPITLADSGDDGKCTNLGGDGKGPLCVSLDRPVRKAGSDPAYDAAAYFEGRLELDQLGTRNLAFLVVGGRVNPALARTISGSSGTLTGKTSHLSASDIEALSMYLRSLQK